MTRLSDSEARQSPARKATGERLFVLDASGRRVFSLRPDGSDAQTLVTNCPLPDGIVVDVEHGHIYWTNMGTPSINNGSIERADLDGGNRRTIVPEGGTWTPKQLQLHAAAGRLYWSDREGMRVMRCKLDGSQLETLVQTGQGDADRRDQTKWCVGLALDPGRGQLYWTQKGSDNSGRGRILRAGLEIPRGQTATSRTDIEVLYDGLPEPIDLDLDLGQRLIYWTDRGDPPRGNTVNRAPLDAPPGGRPEPQIVVTHLMEGIGLSLDLRGGRMFFTDLAGSVYSAQLDGSREAALAFAQGNLTGIAYANLSFAET